MNETAQLEGRSPPQLTKKMYLCSHKEKHNVAVMRDTAYLPIDKDKASHVSVPLQQPVWKSPIAAKRNKRRKN